MYLGKIVEIADADELNENPLHPYTESLLSAIPMPDPNMAKERKRIILRGRCSEPDESAERLCVPHQMPLRDGAVRRKNALP